MRASTAAATVGIEDFAASDHAHRLQRRRHFPPLQGAGFVGSFFVIPGRAKREPGIYNHGGEYGFRACAKWRIPE